MLFRGKRPILGKVIIDKLSAERGIIRSGKEGHTLAISPEKHGRSAGKFLLILCNIVLMLAAVLFTVFYSRNVRTSQEQLMRDNFCNTVETFSEISERYLAGELTDAANWAAYIEQEHMSMDEALDYIRSVSDQADCEAHIVDMDSFEAWSTNTVSDSNTVGIYQKWFNENGIPVDDYVLRMREMYGGEKNVLGKYTTKETGRTFISVGLRVDLRQEDGSDRGYLLLRAVPIERMKSLWLFPTSYDTAEIGLIDDRGWYVIPSKSMRSENFTEFVRYYNFQDDFYGADALLAQLKEQDSGLMELNDSKGQACYWYYSRLSEFSDLEILGYIPVASLSATAENMSIVYIVAGILLLIALIDGAYILSINHRLRVTAEVAERASSAKTRSLSSMSHDIRTPLNAVLGMTELAQSHIDDLDYVQECLRKISLSGNHLLTLINDILDISRVESGRITVNPAPFSVRELVSELEGITRSQAVGHGLDFEVSFRELPEPYLMGDRLRLTQVYLNLLNNAVKYTNPGGRIHMEIGEETGTDGKPVLVCVIEDTGIGMSEEFQKTMYDSFTRVSDSRIDKIQGTGLGLAIVKRMVDLMDGSVECRSTEGAGSTFTVRIPLMEAPAPAEGPKELTENVPEASGDLSGVRILIAEDNDLNWEIISEMLRAYGILCDRAENGRECVNMLNAAEPGMYDLVLMDVQMPVLDGRGATRELRASARGDLRRLPIVAMTADAFAEDVQTCLDAGMDAHVAKPVEIKKVLAAIRLLLSRRNSADGRQG